MGVEVGFWKIEDGTKPQKVAYSAIDVESRLEDIIVADLSILSDDMMLIGRQVRTDHGKYIDLLTIDSEGKLTVVELKRNKTPREVVAQTLDYASWVTTLKQERIKEIFEEYTEIGNEKALEEAFDEHFGTQLPDQINVNHDMLIVCSELDAESERIVNYLSKEYNMPINAVFFRYFKDNNGEYLSRSWMIDPHEVVEKSVASGSKDKGEVWNKRDMVVNIDTIDEVSVWEDAQKYGFTCAGGGVWYNQSLKSLKPGQRVYALIPKKGYVGVGEVVGASTPMKDFKVVQDGKEIPIAEANLVCSGLRDYLNKDENETEYFVPIKWHTTVSQKEAFWKKGLRANQNSAYRLKNEFTIQQLEQFFGVEE
jgi:hypothetical protein